MKIKVLLQMIEWSSVARRWRSKSFYKGSTDWVLQKMKTRWCRSWCSSTEDIEDILVIVTVVDDCWKLPMTYRCISLISLKMLSLVTHIVDYVVVSRIPFSLRGVLKYCNIEEYSKFILLIYPKGDVLFLCRNVTIVFGHHRVMRYILHFNLGH